MLAIAGLWPGTASSIGPSSRRALVASRSPKLPSLDHSTRLVWKFLKSEIRDGEEKTRQTPTRHEEVNQHLQV